MIWFLTHGRRTVIEFLKTTILGGLIFLVPMVALGLILGKAIGIMLVIAEPMANFIPLDAIGGVALANLIAAAIVLLLCFLAGLLARTTPARKLAESAESKILQKIPGYTLIKGITSNLHPEENAKMTPVLVSLASTARIGLEVERVGDDEVAVYFPNSPNAWSGIVQIVPADQVKPLDKPMMSVIDHAEQLGRGTQDMLGDSSNASPSRSNSTP